MAMRLGRSIGAMALVLAMATVGCGGGGSDEEVFPQNTLEIDQVQAAMDPPVDVTYFDDQRWVRLTDVTGSFVELAFEGLGSPATYELPIGHFTEASPELVSVRVCVEHQACRTYDAPGEVNGELSVDGDEGARVIAIGGVLRLSTVDEVVFSYSGAYSYAEDN